MNLSYMPMDAIFTEAEQVVIQIKTNQLIVDLATDKSEF